MNGMKLLEILKMVIPILIGLIEEIVSMSKDNKLNR